MDQEPWPTEIRLSSDRRALQIAFDDGGRYTIPAELLRVESPSAEVQGHSASGKRIVRGKADIEILSVEPVGNYAVRLVFGDGHSTGIFGWGYLAKLGREGRELMRKYRESLG